MTLGTTKVNEGLGSISLVAYTDTAYLHLQIIIFFFSLYTLLSVQLLQSQGSNKCTVTINTRTIIFKLFLHVIHNDTYSE